MTIHRDCGQVLPGNMSVRTVYSLLLGGRGLDKFLRTISAIVRPNVKPLITKGREFVLAVSVAPQLTSDAGVILSSSS
jgi:hypothetical protein